MQEAFWNREDELKKIKGLIGSSVFGYVSGRRRIGKTALLVEACKRYGGLYHQAVEGTPGQQLIHLVDEIKDHVPIFRNVTPKTWVEFFELLSREKLPEFIVFDEFPYWVQGDPTLPSVLQKWIDHKLPKKRTVVLVSGSSQSMLYSQFLSQNSPLYGRAVFRLHLDPMSFEWFCKVHEYSHKDPESFARFALVGGVPHYWKLMPSKSLFKQIDELYFVPSAILLEEPKNLLRDEGITGNIPKALLDLIGRGVTKPSELASRLNTAQSNLSRPLSMLLELGLINRELPFGESVRSTKKVYYSVIDSALSFYYRVYLPYRSRWDILTDSEKKLIINEYVSVQWEHYCRSQHAGSSRYWERDVEIDLVAHLKGKKKYLVAECKWTDLTEQQRGALLSKLREKFKNTKLGKKLKNVEFRIYSKRDLSVF